MDSETIAERFDKLELLVQSSNEKFKTSFSELTNKFETTNAELTNKFETTNADLTNKLQTTNAELKAELQTTSVELKANNAELKKANADLKTELQINSARVESEMRANNTELLAKLESNSHELKTELTAIDKKLMGHLQTINTRLEKSIVHNRNECEAIRADFAKNVKDMTSQFGQKRIEVRGQVDSQLREGFNVINQDLDRCHTSVLANSENIGTLETSHSETRKTLESDQAMIQNLQAKLTEVEQNLNKTTKNMQSARVACGGYKEDLGL